MKLVSWIAGALTALVLVLFALSNRSAVTLGFAPFPVSLELPLYAAVFASLVLGFVAGGIVAWVSGRKSRRRARQAEAEARRLKEALAEARRQPPAPAPLRLPTLPRAS